MDTVQDLEVFARREAEILKRLADRREETISALVRDLVLQTIGEVERLFEKRSEDNPTAAEPSPPIR